MFDALPHGLVLAEAEFATDEGMYSLEPPSGVVTEATVGPRSTGPAPRTESP